MPVDFQMFVRNFTGLIIGMPSLPLIFAVLIVANEACSSSAGSAGTAAVSAATAPSAVPAAATVPSAATACAVPSAGAAAVTAAGAEAAALSLVWARTVLPNERTRAIAPTINVAFRACFFADFFVSIIFYFLFELSDFGNRLACSNLCSCRCKEVHRSGSTSFNLQFHLHRFNHDYCCVCFYRSAFSNACFKECTCNRSIH